jgi:hypothetical protein
MLSSPIGPFYLRLPPLPLSSFEETLQSFF